MKSGFKILAIIITLCVIVLGVVYIFLNQNSSDDEEQSETVLAQEVREELRQFKMTKRIKQKGLILRRENFTQISDYQKYVTPNNQIVQSYIALNSITSIKQAYTTAVNWIWVSDSVLHNKQEKWLLPAEFISDTPSDPDNPSPGNMVSDCESQAYTLVSLLEALGTNKDDVRVVAGEVDFSGEIGGHAWVQIYQNGQWFELEATSGPYWDEEDQEIIQNTGFPFLYFKTKPYPVVDYWAFFNDIYYYNPDTGLKSPNLPVHWLKT